MRVLRLGLYLSCFFVLVSCASTATKRSVGEVVDDAVISNKLKVKYLKDKQVKGFKVNVDTWKGVVTLRGRMENQEQINRAIQIAERERGVKVVKSYLVISSLNLQSESSKEEQQIVEKDLKESTRAPEDNAQPVQKPAVDDGATYATQPAKEAPPAKKEETVTHIPNEDQVDLDGPPEVITGY